MASILIIDPDQTARLRIAAALEKATAEGTYGAAAAEEEAGGWERFFRRSGIDVLGLSTDRPYVDDVRSLFKRRARKRR